ncbi:MAG: tRNA lysidine(34) synthetase TilS, partial [Clostridia bacterium]
ADKIAERVLTAHHLGDQTESVLMHIFRGTGINGLCGMSFDDGVLIRPLLSVSKSQIQDFASANAIDYVTDSTNTQTDYSRNKIRLDIIPQLTSVYGNIDGNIARLTAVATQIKTFVNNHCPTPIKEGDCVKVKTEWLLERDFISAELVARAVESLTTRVDLTKEHIDMVYDLATATNAQKINLPFGVVAYKEYDFISFTLAKNSNESITFAQFGQGQFDCGSWIVNISTTDNGGLVCDLNTLKDCVLRTRATGDTFKKFGGGTKSLGDFFTDKKTPLRQRPSIVLLAKGSTIMAALPYEISDLAKTTPATTQKVFVKAEQKNL